jgi:hypothetical protein
MTFLGGPRGWIGVKFAVIEYVSSFFPLPSAKGRIVVGVVEEVGQPLSCTKAALLRPALSAGPVKSLSLTNPNRLTNHSPAMSD